MKVFSKFLALGAVLAASSSLAFGATITNGSSFQLSGNDTYTNNGSGGQITFGSSQLGAAGDTGTMDITGTFATYLTDGVTGSAVTFVSPLSYANGTHTLSSTQIFSVVGSGGETFTFDLTGYDATYMNYGGGNTALTIAGSGTFQSTATSPVVYSATPGSFIFSSQVVNGKTSTTFSASAAATGVTPEPNSLVLLGTGLIGAAGMLFMRRRQAQGLL